MNCLSCSSKACKKEAKDCNQLKGEILPLYHQSGEQRDYQIADNLVSGGKAGKLTRVEELLLYIQQQEYKSVAIAYCYSMEEQAKQFMNYLKQNAIKTSSFRCTINGIQEKEIGISQKESVNCNPIGQAEAINRSKAEMVIEMGLCLGHDILFHQYLKKPFTVLAVKDRVLKHKPLEFFDKSPSTMTSFISSLNDTFNMLSIEAFNKMQDENPALFILDLRQPQAFNSSHIPGSINIPLKELPESRDKLPQDINTTIVVYCSGSVQSAYALAFLFEQGYQRAVNLSGGYSKWQELEIRK
ncbi:MAG: DUF1847 domain-containing protein [Spirochaetales bacterium]|nr:DUF1847 domain-containing protein [Spirochaetales bacterium]